MSLIKQEDIQLALSPSLNDTATDSEFSDSDTVVSKESKEPQESKPSAYTDSRSDFDSYALTELEKRIGPIHLKTRLGIEERNEAKVFGQGRNFFHIENWALAGFLIRNSLRLLQLMRRGQRNARAIEVRHNHVTLPNLPSSFEDYTLLHISDSHLDMAEGITEALIEAINKTEYDLCVWTGDFRGKTHGNYDRAISNLQQVMPHLNKEVYAILGNHDTIRMVPEMEAMGVKVLLNEHIAIKKTNDIENDHLYIAGIDDPHFYRADNIEKAADPIPDDATSILLAHSPEIYQHATFANFDLMLCGHTHGGQICLPGAKPIMINANCPREFGAGAWRYQNMQGYTSVGSGACVVDVRFNCPPEITLHHLHREKRQEASNKKEDNKTASNNKHQEK